MNVARATKCIAYSEKKRRRCLQVGTVDVVGGDKVCAYSHAIMLRDGETVLHAETKKPLELLPSSAHSYDGVTWFEEKQSPPPPPPASPVVAAAAEASPPPAELLELPEHSGPDSEEITAPAATGVDLGALERKAQSAWGKAPEDPAKADEEVAREQEQLGLGAALAWSPQRCAWWLSLLNPMLKKHGKDELTKSELEQGGQVLSPVMIDIMGSWAVGKYGALAFWAAVTFGPRYAPEIAGWIRSRLRARAGGQERAQPATDRTPAEPQQDVYDL